MRTAGIINPIDPVKPLGQGLTEEQTDHILEQLWMAAEDDKHITLQTSLDHGETCGASHSDGASRAGSASCTVGTHLGDLKGSGLVEEREGRITLTHTGHARAERLIRRHRLAEMLLTQILDMEVEANQDDVCLLEHAISLRVAERICAFLGHPPVCPHGRPIPRGKCCKTQKREIAPLVAPLSDVRTGESYRIVFIAPVHGGRLDRLAVLGIIPGTDIHLHQKKPSYVVRIAETDVAIDTEIAREIFVRPA